MKEKEMVLNEFRTKCQDFYKMLLKLFDNNDDLLFAYIVAIAIVNDDKAKSILMYPVIKAYEKISILEGIVEKTAREEFSSLVEKVAASKEEKR